MGQINFLTSKDDGSLHQCGMSLLKAVPSWPYNFSFAFLNLSSYFVLTGPVIILMMRSWGASATQVGILLSMMPATQLVQLFVAPYIEKYGINKFVIGGLAFRNIFNVLLCILPFFAGLYGHVRAMYILLAIMFFVDMSHSIGYAGWMTWVSWLVPESHRGRYFSIEQLMSTAGQTIVIFTSGAILGETPVDQKFGIFLVVGAVMGWLSIISLSKVPSPPKLANPPKAEMFWIWIRPVLKIEAFRKLLYVLVGTTMMVMIGSFNVMYMTEDLKIKQNFVLYMGSAGTIGSVISVYFWGLLADKFGSKPVMVLGQRLMLIGAIYWFAMSLGMPYYHIAFIMAAGFITAIGLFAYVVTGFRYVCSAVPREYLIYGTVIFNLTVQISASIGPIIWGRLLDLLDKLNLQIGSVTVTRFTPIYTIMLGWVVLANIFAKRLPDGEHKMRSHAVAIHGIKEFCGFLTKRIRQVKSCVRQDNFT